MARPSITKYLKNIFENGELKEISVSSILEHTAADGKTFGAYHFGGHLMIINSKAAKHLVDKYFKS